MERPEIRRSARLSSRQVRRKRNCAGRSSSATSTFALQRNTGAARHQPEYSGRQQPGHCRPHRLGQDHAGEPDSARVRCRARQRADRRAARSAISPSTFCAATSASFRRRLSCSATRSRENIAFGVEDATDEDDSQRRRSGQYRQPTSRAFPTGYDTMVGERGITLSGGQKQRTAIARAIIRNPRILILDDALSSVDTHTEDKILNHLREIMRGRTTIFISHRVSTVRNADRIAVLHGGRIVELRHARRTDRARTATTPTSTTSNCWKKNWRRFRVGAACLGLSWWRCITSAAPDTNHEASAQPRTARQRRRYAAGDRRLA